MLWVLGLWVLWPLKVLGYGVLPWLIPLLKSFGLACLSCRGRGAVGRACGGALYLLMHCPAKNEEMTEKSGAPHEGHAGKNIVPKGRDNIFNRRTALYKPWRSADKVQGQAVKVFRTRI